MPDIALLLQTARPAGVSRDSLLAAVAEGPDWTRVIQAALDHGTAGLLAARLLTIASALPDELVAALHAYHDDCRDRDAVRVGELRGVLDALAAAGVAALPFKGPALARLAYDAPALRRCGDLDLLIAESDIDDAFAALATLGFESQYPHLRPALRRAYRRYNGQDMLLAPERMPVEPHWAFAPRTLAVPLDTAAMFARARPVDLGGGGVPTLAVEDALLVSCLNGAKEQWTRLIWVADVAGLLTRHPALDAAVVLERAAAAGLRRVLLLGVALASDLLAAPCPPALAAALAGDPAAGRLAAEVAARLRRLPAPGPAPSVFAFTGFRWRMRERPSDRWRYGLRTLLAARVPHYGVVDLPDSLIGLYPLVRLAHDFVALPLWRAFRKPPAP